MTIKNGKSVIKKYFEENILFDNLIFDKNVFGLIYNQEDYVIEFDFFVDDFGGKICISSQCIYKLKIIDEFYSKSKAKRIWLNNFGVKTIYLNNIYSGLNKLADDNDFKLEKDENFNQNLISFLDDLSKKIIFIISKLKFELENNLKKEFNFKKEGVFEFISLDLVILYHYFKPNELYKYLIHLKNNYSKMTDEYHLENYKILLKEICELNNFDYNVLEPKQTFFTKLKAIFKSE